MRAGRILLALAATAAIAAPAAVGAPSDLDTSFGKGGKSYKPDAIVGLGEYGTYFTSLRLLSDGRIAAPRRGAVRQRLLGLDARGRSDRTFGARRLRSVAKEIIGLDVDLRRGRIVIGAGAFTTYGASGVLLVRLRGGEAPRPKAR